MRHEAIQLPASSHANRVHRVALGLFRIVARPFLGTELGTRIARRLPLARTAYYQIYSLVGQTVVEVELPFGKLTLDLRDRSVSQNLFVSRQYEPTETELLTRLITTGMTFYDVGAHVGYYTLLASRQVGSKGRVYAFEPDPWNCALLKENVRINDLTNVEVTQAAVGREDGQAYLYRNRDYTGDHRICATKETRESVAVQSTTLDAHYRKSGRPDVMKVDVQGAEGQILAGMGTLLSEAPPYAILSEFWPCGLANAGTDPVQFLETLRKAEYDVFEVSEGPKCTPISDAAALVNRLAGEEDYTNVLCMRSNALPDWLNGEV
jgi:FkbM family methyltransferase